MKKTKLEAYQEILSALEDNPSTISSIAYSCNADVVFLRNRLDFLLANGLVEEKIIGKKTVYALTRRGRTVYLSLNVTQHLEKLKPDAIVNNNLLLSMPSEMQKKTKRYR